jgi:RimJ/RimL family protein N-acetyltransferase
MFARTSRLLLRPGWAEDAPALVHAMADEAVCRDVWSAPWPFTLRDAEAFLAQPRDPILPSLLIFERTDAAPRLVGACGLRRRASGAVELYVWMARGDRGRGFATEACRALLDIAATLGFRQVEAAHYADSPAASRLLEKLGFRSTGVTALRRSCARRTEAPVRLVRARLCDRPAELEPLAA